MLEDESDHDLRCQQRSQQNSALLDDSSRWLPTAGLGVAAIRSHRANLDVDLNQLLLYADTLMAAAGIGYVGQFLGD